MIGEDKHNFFKCEDCLKDLADVVVTRDSDEISNNFVAICPFCGGQSKEKTIIGFVHIGSVPGTSLTSPTVTSSKVVINLKKEQ